MAKKSKFMSWLGFGKSDKKQAEADKQQALAQQQEAERLAAEKAEAEREEQSCELRQGRGL